MIKGKLYEVVEIAPQLDRATIIEFLDEAKKEYPEAVKAAPYDYIMVDSWFEKWFGDEEDEG